MMKPFESVLDSKRIVEDIISTASIPIQNKRLQPILIKYNSKEGYLIQKSLYLSLCTSNNLHQKPSKLDVSFQPVI